MYLKLLVTLLILEKRSCYLELSFNMRLFEFCFRFSNWSKRILSSKSKLTFSCK